MENWIALAAFILAAITIPWACLNLDRWFPILPDDEIPERDIW